jgi:hypothetical protein
MTNANNNATGQTDAIRIGPLASHIDGFAALLHRQGYVAESVRQKCALLTALSKWLDGRGLPLDKLDEALVSQFHKDNSRPDHQRMPRGHDRSNTQLFT